MPAVQLINEEFWMDDTSRLNS